MPPKERMTDSDSDKRTSQNMIGMTNTTNMKNMTNMISMINMTNMMIEGEEAKTIQGEKEAILKRRRERRREEATARRERLLSSQMTKVQKLNMMDTTHLLDQRKERRINILIAKLRIKISWIESLIKTEES